jgi:hypothetical protein
MESVTMWRLAFSGALLGLVIGEIIWPTPIHRTRPDAELIEEAYGQTVERIFLVYTENLAGSMSDDDATARFQKSLNQVRKARVTALEIVTK